MNKIDEEILVALADNPNGLRRKDLFKKCESANFEYDISLATRRLISGGFIMEMASRHRNQVAVYGLSELTDLSTEADAGNAESGIYDDEYLTTMFGELSNADNGSDSVDGDIDTIIKGLVSLKKRFCSPKIIVDLDIKMQCLEKLSAIVKDDIAAILDDIASDLQGLSHE